MDFYVHKIFIKKKYMEFISILIKYKYIWKIYKYLYRKCACINANLLILHIIIFELM